MSVDFTPALSSTYNCDPLFVRAGAEVSGSPYTYLRSSFSQIHKLANDAAMKAFLRNIQAEGAETNFLNYLQDLYPMTIRIEKRAEELAKNSPNFLGAFLDPALCRSERIKQVLLSNGRVADPTIPAKFSNYAERVNQYGMLELFGALTALCGGIVYGGQKIAKEMGKKGNEEVWSTKVGYYSFSKAEDAKRLREHYKTFHATKLPTNICYLDRIATGKNEHAFFHFIILNDLPAVPEDSQRAAVRTFIAAELTEPEKSTLSKMKGCPIVRGRRNQETTPSSQACPVKGLQKYVPNLPSSVELYPKRYAAAALVILVAFVAQMTFFTSSSEGV